MLTNGEYLARIERILDGKGKVTPRQRDLLLLMGMHQLQTHQVAIAGAVNSLSGNLSAHADEEMRIWSDFGARVGGLEDGLQRHLDWAEEKLAEVQSQRAADHPPDAEDKAEAKLGKMAVTWEWLRDKLMAPMIA